jgi:hypothetical protein
VLARDNFDKVAKKMRIPPIMLKAAIIFYGLILLSGNAPAGDSPETAAMLTIRAEAIGAHVKFLFDDVLEGRGTGMRDGIVSSVAVPS